jgi:hypothetical protein
MSFSFVSSFNNLKDNQGPANKTILKTKKSTKKRNKDPVFVKDLIKAIPDYVNFYGSHLNENYGMNFKGPLATLYWQFERDVNDNSVITSCRQFPSKANEYVPYLFADPSSDYFKRRKEIRNQVSSHSAFSKDADFDITEFEDELNEAIREANEESAQSDGILQTNEKTPEEFDYNDFDELTQYDTSSSDSNGIEDYDYDFSIQSDEDLPSLSNAKKVDNAVVDVFVPASINNEPTMIDKNIPVESIATTKKDILGFRPVKILNRQTKVTNLLRSAPSDNVKDMPYADFRSDSHAKIPLAYCLYVENTQKSISGRQQADIDEVKQFKKTLPFGGTFPNNRGTGNGYAKGDSTRYVCSYFLSSVYLIHFNCIIDAKHISS